MRAANAHLSGRHEDAIAGFQQVARTTDIPKLGVQALHAAGVVYSDLGAYDRSFACLEQAHELFPEECGHPLILLNLAAAAGMAKRWQDALKWTDLADQALAEALAEGGPGPNVRPEWKLLILGSKLQAYMQLGATAQADEVFKQMSFRAVEGMRTAGVLGVVTAYAVQRDAGVEFMAHLPELQQLANADSAATVAELGGYATLFEPWRSQVWGDLPFEQVWAQVRQMPQVLSSSGTVGVGREEGSLAGRGAGFFLLPFAVRAVQGAAGLLFFIALCGTFQASCLWRARRKARKWSPEREGELVQVLRKQIANKQGLWWRMEARWLLVEVLRRRGFARLLRLGDGVRNLTRREEEFVMHLAAGLRTKEFARIHRLSAGHAYNLSSSVRRKLQVPDSVELADFILSNERTEA